MRFPEVVLFTLALFAPTSSAATTQTPDCRIDGDPDVFGLGIRISFYLQWAALLIQLFCRLEAAASARSAAVITVSAVTINTLRNLHSESLVAVEWTMLYNIFTLLITWHIPITEITRRELDRTGGTYFVLFMILALYQILCPYIIFHAWEYGRQPHCSANVIFWAPIDAYSQGWTIFLKITWVLAPVMPGAVYLAAAFYSLFKWLKSWGVPDMGMAKLISRLDESLDGDEGEISDAVLGRWFKFLALISGAIGIGFLEGTIKTNNIAFGDTQLTDSGQLIPLLIGVFSLASTMFDAIRARIGSSNSVEHVKEGHKSNQVEGGKL